MKEGERKRGRKRRERKEGGRGGKNRRGGIRDRLFRQRREVEGEEKEEASKHDQPCTLRQSFIQDQA